MTGSSVAAGDPASPDPAAGATTSVGMAVALGALTMTFAALLLAYAIVRAQAPNWPPVGEAALPRGWMWAWPIAATLAALLGSAAIEVARRARHVKQALGATAIAGLTFLAIQCAGWSWLLGQGVRPGSGIVASVVYALTLFHGLHALAALAALLPILVRALRGRAVSASKLKAVSAFWHLVTAVWIVVFLSVFVA